MKMIELTNEAYALVRNGVTTKSSRGGVYKVQMPQKLAAKLEALRGFGEELSDVILRLAEQARQSTGRSQCQSRARPSSSAGHGSATPQTRSQGRIARLRQ
jgi:hypothetical protein